MRDQQLGVLVLPLLFVAAITAGQQGPRLELSPTDVLTDEPFRVAVSGLKPGQAVTIRASAGPDWQSSLDFTADASGRIEPPDPMKFVWSVSRETTVRPFAGSGTQQLTFTAETDGQAIATGTIVRRAIAADVRIAPVRERGLVGVAYYPPGSERRPAIIVLPGSTGGIPGVGSFVGGLASRGYVVLALAYFNAEGLPPMLQNIPLEYFSTAIEWLKAQASVDPTAIGVLGTSRGGELALLLGATYPSAFRVVVANVPSSVVWPGLSDESVVPAWTLNGKPLISVPAEFTKADLDIPGRQRFLKRMTDRTALARAAIPVERIASPVLMFSGKDDQLWPSDVFAAQVVERLKAHNFKYAVEHHSYDNAGHAIARPYVPTADVQRVRPHPISKRPNRSGGTPEGQARANVDAWDKLLAFLNKYLRRN